MNKLIIVGNGFDLNNGLPSSYVDFIRWQIGNMIECQLRDEPSENKQMTLSMASLGSATDPKYCENIEDIVDEIFRPALFGDNESFTRPIVYKKAQYHCVIKPISLLYQKVFSKYASANWVDVEIEYFNILKEILHQSSQNRHDEKNAFIKLRQVNDDLQQTIKDLKEYLIQTSNKTTVKERFADLANKEIDINIFNEEQHIKKLAPSKFLDDNGKYLIPESILFLNFNYTGLTEKLNDRKGVFSHLDIHGSIHQKQNDLVFGYGDEVGDEYIQIEKTNNNDFLRFVKSFAYSQNKRYSELLRFINAEPYIIYIWGHSCALSDRTLLNMLFEHNNCAAIQPFYWQKSEDEDNYTEIIQNMSRHFNNKQKFRTRLVNKQYCSPL